MNLPHVVVAEAPLCSRLFPLEHVTAGLLKLPIAIAVLKPTDSLGESRIDDGL